ncbi:hypothetical protein Tco_0642672 [Tanacetum coccineum]
MSSYTHPSIPSDYDVEDAFSSTNAPNYILTPPGYSLVTSENIFPNPFEEISPPKDTETPIESPVPVSPSSSVRSSSPVSLRDLVFSRSRCAEENKVTFATGTLTDDALSWWNAHAQPMGIERANQITWTKLKRLLTNKYCPRTEIKKMEEEFYAAIMITISSKIEARKPSTLMETMDIMDLIPFVGNVLCITQDLVLSGVRNATK